MKTSNRAFLLLSLLLTLTMAGCTSSQYGNKCVGLANEDQKKPGVQYDLSWWNMFMLIIFSETLIVPIVVVGFELQCPTSAPVIGGK